MEKNGRGVDKKDTNRARFDRSLFDHRNKKYLRDSRYAGLCASIESNQITILWQEERRMEEFMDESRFAIGRRPFPLNGKPDK